MPLHRAWAILWDARGLLAILGVILHSARVYAPNAVAVSNPELHIGFRHLVDLIHAFRMETFFLLSGAALLFVRTQSNRQFLQNRIQRLLIPFAVTVALLNLPVLELISLLSIMPPDGAYPYDILSADYWLGGAWLMHLWFIRNLMIYTALYALLKKAKKSLTFPIPPLPAIPKRLQIAIAMLILLAPASLGYLLPFVSRPILGANHLLLGSLQEHLHYGMYFTAGILVSRKRSWLLALTTRRYWSIPACFAIITTQILLTRGPLEPGTIIQFLQNKTLYLVAAELSRQLSAFALMFLALQLTDGLRHGRFQPMLHKWAKSSYTIYLIHQPVIWALALALQGLPGPMLLKFSFMVIAAVVLCEAFDRVLVVGRIQWTRLLFAGTLKPAKMA